MRNSDETKKPLVEEWNVLRLRIAEPEKSGDGLKRAEDALCDSEASFRRIINKSAHGIIIMSRSGIVLFANPAAESLLACKAGDTLVGKQSNHLIVAGETTELIIPRNRETCVAEMRVVETEWEDESAYLVTIHDITKHKRVEEELRELDRMKSELISNVSHELRSRLHAIRGFTSLILKDKVPNPEIQKEFLGIIDGQSEHLGVLINSLLDMARLEAGRFQTRKQRLLIKDLIHESVVGFYTLANEKGIVITEDIPAALPEIEADGEGLRQVIANLLSNAIKFSDASRSIIVKSEAKDGELLVQFTDHGVGIPREAMPHLFERFYQAKRSMGRGGAGLGLYISKQIVEAHNGRIWAESKVGQGSTFSFTLPLYKKRLKNGSHSHE